MRFNQRERSNFRSVQRRGAITVLMALLLPVLCIIAAFTINIAFLQLTRTELMVATDAAARAGGRGISSYQDIDQAMQAAKATGLLNTVNGIPLKLNKKNKSGEIDFGDAELSNSSGRFEFKKVNRGKIRNGKEQAAAIRITGTMGGTHSLRNPIHAMFPTFGMDDEYDMSSQAVAMQVDRDIALILDRSGSMDEHPGWDWPNGYNPWNTTSLNAGVDEGVLGYNNHHGYYYYQSGENSRSYQTWLWEDHYELGAAPKTPWDELVEAVNVFLDILLTTDQDEQVSIASYATTASLDIRLKKDYSLIRAELDTLNPAGWTAIGDGMNAGVPTLLDQYSRPYAAKTLLVMTDGVHNRGVSPNSAAQSIVSNYDVTIHSITFGQGADQPAMKTVATTGGGDHYHAADGDELQESFEEIANNLPTIVMQ